MQSDINKLSEEFEKEIWLYIDESLPEERMKFWDEHITRFPQLQQMLNETNKVLSLYDESVEHQLNDKSFNAMIENATADNKDVLNSIKNIFNRFFAPFFTQHRLAFGAAIIAFIVLLTFIIEKPNGNNIQQTPRLDWKGNDLTSKLDKVGNSIDEMKTENTLEYQMYRFTKDKFDVAIQSIGDRIEKLKDNMKNESL